MVYVDEHGLFLCITFIPDTYLLRNNDKEILSVPFLCHCFSPQNTASGNLISQKSQQVELPNQVFSECYTNCYLQSEVWRVAWFSFVLEEPSQFPWKMDAAWSHLPRFVTPHSQVVCWDFLSWTTEWRGKGEKYEWQYLEIICCSITHCNS